MGKIKHNELSAYIIDGAFLCTVALYVLISLISNAIVATYFSIFAIGAVLVLAIVIIGFTRDRSYLKNPAARTVLSIVIAFGLISYTLGIFLGFNYGYKITKSSILWGGFVPELALAIEIELIRYVLSRNITPKQSTRILFALSSIIFYIAIAFSPEIFQSSEAIFIFICKVVFVVIAREAACSYINYRAGLLPTLVYKLIIVSYAYILPIVPNLGDYIYCVINILISFTSYIAVSHLELSSNEDRRRIRVRNFSILAIPAILCSIALAILITGVFQYKMIAIASNSMSPTYSRGDAVIYEKTQAQNIQKGDILVLEKDGRIVTHRVVSIIEDGEKFSFITKGDGNDDIDGWETPSTSVLGKVVLINKYIGYPTVWLSEQIK